jgi:hypothetical protein
MVCSRCGHAEDIHHVIGRDEELQHDKVVCKECDCDSDGKVGNPSRGMSENMTIVLNVRTQYPLGYR